MLGSSLITCIKDGYKDFFPLLFVYLFWLWNCIDFIFWMTVRAVVDWTCTLTANTLLWFIDKIIEPNITVEQVFAVLFWIISPPLLIMNLLSAILPAFHHHHINYKSSLFRVQQCSSGRHVKRGRHVNRNYVWWQNQLHHSLNTNSTTNSNNTYPPSKQSFVQKGFL